MSTYRIILSGPADAEHAVSLALLGAGFPGVEHHGPSYCGYWAEPDNIYLAVEGDIYHARTAVRAYAYTPRLYEEIVSDSVWLPPVLPD